MNVLPRSIPNISTKELYLHRNWTHNLNALELQLHNRWAKCVHCNLELYPWIIGIFRIPPPHTATIVVQIYITPLPPFEWIRDSGKEHYQANTIGSSFLYFSFFFHNFLLELICSILLPTEADKGITHNGCYSDANCQRKQFHYTTNCNPRLRPIIWGIILAIASEDRQCSKLGQDSDQHPVLLIRWWAQSCSPETSRGIQFHFPTEHDFPIINHVELLDNPRHNYHFQKWLWLQQEPKQPLHLEVQCERSLSLLTGVQEVDTVRV